MKISYQSKQQGIISIFVDEEPWKDIHSSIFGKKPAFPRQVASMEEWVEFFHTSEYQGALKFVMRRLSLQAQLSIELTCKLSEKLVSEHTTNRVLTECTRLGYLDDASTLHIYIQGLLRRGYGPQAILPKLLRKKIPFQHAKEMIERLNETTDHIPKIRHLLETKFRSRDLSDHASKQKTIASLLRKGFSFDDIKQALSSK